MSGGGQDKSSQQGHDLIGFGSQFNTHWYGHSLFHSQRLVHLLTQFRMSKSIRAVVLIVYMPESLFSGWM
jgi:hypothetical protein